MISCESMRSQRTAARPPGLAAMVLDSLKGANFLIERGRSFGRHPEWELATILERSREDLAP